MAKLSLVAAPTFKAKVAIPVAGGSPVDVEFTFIHRTQAQLDEFVKQLKDMSNSEAFLAMVSGWDLEDAFNQENVEVLLQNHISAARATYEKYFGELVQAKLGN